ncbi:MAG: cyclic nucleotide-binding domain-containing protein [Ignavibacteriales bacterium]|jgi:CRP-like cAMP-binding protein|nr:cyclic nucleotide-binding domain-containing protein [Ignavibacteriales bacterium]
MEVFGKGEDLAREGDSTFEIFVLMKGKIGIYKGNVKVAEFDQKGIIFGEMGAILGEPRTATMKAEDTSSVLVIEGDLDKLMDNYPDIAKKIMINLASRLKNITEDYSVLIDQGQ